MKKRKRTEEKCFCTSSRTTYIFIHIIIYVFALCVCVNNTKQEYKAIRKGVYVRKYSNETTYEFNLTCYFRNTGYVAMYVVFVCTTHYMYIVYCTY